MSEKMQTELHHNVIAIPEGKNPSDIVGERHEIFLLIHASKVNPNGDPDTGNMPRLQPGTLRGLMTDVCLKRKIRNFFSLYHPDGTLLSDGTKDGYQIFIRENAILQHLMESEDIAKKAEAIFDACGDEKKGTWKASGKGKSEQVTRAFRDALCRTFFDVRCFGGVVSTEGPLKGSFYGQIRGPIQIGFAESLDRVLQLDFTITRCASASEKEQKQESDSEGGESGNRTMGRKHTIDFGLYVSHIYLSPAFALKTGFTYYDLDNFLFALQHMFKDDPSSARPERMSVVGLVDFQHSTALGNEHAHKLFNMVKVARSDVDAKGKPIKEYPEGLKDYCGSAPDGPVVTAKEGDEEKALVTAHKIIWEIPECPKTNAD